MAPEGFLASDGPRVQPILEIIKMPQKTGAMSPALGLSRTAIKPLSGVWLYGGLSYRPNRNTGSLQV